ncbi:hypothetical protein Tco_0694799 [Tanacetum coccineum]
MTQKLGLRFGSTKKACFVYGSYSHLIKDCDFHEKRMAKKYVLQSMGKNTSQREIRPVWNNTQRINHQNKFVPTAVLTRSGRIPVSTAKQYVNTATPKNRVNVSKSKINTFPKSHSPIRRPFYKSTVLNTRVSKEKVNTVRVNGVNTAGQTAVSTVKGNGVTAVKASAGCVWRPKMTDLNNGSKDNSGSWISKRGNPQQALKYKGMFDSGCSRHMTGNKALLTDYQDIDGGFVAFGGSTRGGKITGIGKIRTNKIDFEDVFFVKELKFNLFSVSQMCDKKNSVLFTETECLVLSPDFKLIDESQVLLRVPRQNNMYSFDLKNVVPSGDLTCLFAKATIDESNLHRRLGSLTKPHNKTPYELIIGRAPIISFMRPFGCLVTILNSLDPLGKFDGKAEEEFLVGLSVNRQLSRVFKLKPEKLRESAMSTETMEYSYKSSDDKAEDDTVDDDACLLDHQVDHHLFLLVDLLLLMLLIFLMILNAELEISQALDDESWVEAMQEELLQFKIQKMDVKSAFLYGTIEEEQKEDEIFISQDTYVGEILKKFSFSSIRTASTPMETNKALTKDEDGEDVDVHLFSSAKSFHLNAVKRIFRYLKGQPKLGLWYPKDSPLTLESFSDSDYAGASLDRKSTQGGCQFLGSRLISWQCKKQTVVAITTEVILIR